MLEVTWPDGRKAQIDPSRVLRIRRAVYGEDGKTRIDLTAARYQLVMEQPEEIARLVGLELRSLASIRGVEGNPVWFNAKTVTGPVYVTPFEREGTAIKSALLIFPPKKQYTLETAAEVARIITNAGGTPEPLPPEDNLLTTLGNWVRSMWRQPVPPAQPPADDGPEGAVLER
ncbi:MAG: hypothetical protein JNK84_03040 [Phreatobacter sp.]|uniref:hypothetical protein n=1 Tax=Phreatobacter sp. TaxID=1966341 RepID=UPI001A50B113|nr:hypothetical protein [Phreatobacter sp.]MBL8568039.1 hypothetical protein [Phreatobacter sp.]